MDFMKDGKIFLISARVPEVVAPFMYALQLILLYCFWVENNRYFLNILSA